MALQKTHGRMVEDASIGTTDIADSAITAAKIPDNAIVEAKIAANAIVEAKIGAGAVTDAKITGMSSSKLSGALPAISGAALTDTIYDIAFIAGFDKDMVKEDVSVRTYGEIVMARAGTFVGEAGYVDTVATGAILIVDIQKNGSSIYSTKPQFAISATALTAGTLSTTTFAVNDRITFKVTQKGSSAAGKGVRFTLKCKV